MDRNNLARSSAWTARDAASCGRVYCTGVRFTGVTVTFISCSVLLLYNYYSRNPITGLPKCRKKAPKKGQISVVFLQQNTVINQVYQQGACQLYAREF